ARPGVERLLRRGVIVPLASGWEPLSDQTRPTRAAEVAAPVGAGNPGARVPGTGPRPRFRVGWCFPTPRLVVALRLKGRAFGPDGTPDAAPSKQETSRRPTVRRGKVGGRHDRDRVPELWSASAGGGKAIQACGRLPSLWPPGS